MIEYIKLVNFKCFREQTFPLRQLTVLSGMNGMGKSSVVLSLLLFRQSMSLNLGSDLQLLQLNNELAQFGKSSDLLYQGAKQDRFDMEIKFQGNDLPLNYGLKNCDFSRFSNEPLFANEFVFLKAERMGPRTLLPTSENFGRLNHSIGYAGEFVGQFLLEFGSKAVVNPILHHPKEKLTSLKLQTEAWMSEISPGVRLKLDDYPKLDSIQMRFAFFRGNEESDAFRAPNVGFGISYALPIVVSLLTPFKNNLIILENPESHLHPAGQAALGRLIACAASAGHQIILETHSDHILNGIRVAILQKKLNSEQLSTIYFAPDPDELQPKIFFPSIDSRGRYDDWPDGFFDQWEKSLDELI